jgi:putative redox protein
LSILLHLSGALPFVIDPGTVAWKGFASKQADTKVTLTASLRILDIPTMTLGLFRYVATVVHRASYESAPLFRLRFVETTSSQAGHQVHLNTLKEALFAFNLKGGITMASNVSVMLKTNGGTVIIGKARSHLVTIDRPEEKGGSNLGPMGGELLLLALGGCFMSTFLAALKADDCQVDTAKIEIQVNGVLAAAPSRFSEIVVSLFAPLSMKELISKSLVKAERGCIVHNTLKDSMPVRFDYTWLQVEPGVAYKSDTG